MKIRVAGAEYEVRSYRESDEPSVLELHNLVFGAASEARLRQREWRFTNNPCGVQRTSVCSSENGKIICVYAGIPLRGQLLGDPVTFSLMADSMTHPGYRGAVLGRRGLFIRTALHWIDRNTGPEDLAFGFGNPQVRHARLGKLLLGYELWDDLGRYSRTLEDTLLKRIRRRIGDPRIAEVGEFGEEADRLWSRVSGDYSAAVIRDRRYLSWRYRDGPQGDYIVLASRSSGGTWSGWVIFAVRGGVSTVVDAIVPRNPAVADALLYRAIGYSLDRGAHSIEGWATAKSSLGRLYGRAGFARERQAGTRFACRLFAPMDKAAVRRGLYIQPGDTDDF